jgi:hypothetical protein
MTAIATLLADLERLKSARRLGVRRVEFEDFVCEYKSDAEMTAAIRAIEAEVLGGAGVRNTVFRSPDNKGW